MKMKSSEIAQCFVFSLFYIALIFEELPAAGAVRSCRRLNLQNGVVKFGGRKMSRLAKFVCNPDYTLIGDQFAICRDGKWDLRMPICIKSGCPLFPSLNNGIQFYMKDEAVAMFFCNPNFSLEGSNTSYCNGTHWNATQPTCTSTSKSVAMSCNFENEDLCGWINDPRHNFDWTRKNLKTPSGFIGTGPSFDHTLGFGDKGYYMYIESSSRLENDTARLLSPIYPSILSRDGCFTFYYHMYGRTTGTLRVYVHPEHEDFSKILTDPDMKAKYTMFEKSGNQGDVWYRGFFNLDEMTDNFQFVIEGVRGPGYVSDIAIDDVSIQQGGNCSEVRSDPLFSTTLPVIVKDSCVNRCDKPINKTNNGELTECQCNSDCYELNACCVDYREFCMFAVTSTMDTTMSEDGTYAPMLPTPLKAAATLIPNEEITTQESTSTESTSTKTTPTTPSTTVKTTPKTTPTTTPKPTTKTTTQSTTTEKKTIPTTKSTPSTKPTQTTSSTSTTRKAVIFDKKTIYNVIQVNKTNEGSQPVRNNYTGGPKTEFSKHYGHYGRDENGFLPTTKMPTVQKVTNATINYKHTNERITQVAQKVQVSTLTPTTIILIIFGIVLVAVIAISVRFESVRNTIRNIPSQVSDLHQRWTRTQSLSSSQADMRFLVQDEELENYFD